MKDGVWNVLEDAAVPRVADALVGGIAENDAEQRADGEELKLAQAKLLKRFLKPREDEIEKRFDGKGPANCIPRTGPADVCGVPALNHEECCYNEAAGWSGME